MNMSTPAKSGKRRGRQIIAVAIIAIGFFITVFAGIRAVAPLRRIERFGPPEFGPGEPNVEAIRPWMTIHFVAMAYAVPEDYIYSQLGIPAASRDARRPLRKLPREHAGEPHDAPPLPVEQVKNVILTYRAHPVATGLSDVQSWMSVKYVSNSTGVPAEHIFAQIGAAMVGNEYKPLDMIAREQHYQGGAKALIENVQRALDTYQRQ